MHKVFPSKTTTKKIPKYINKQLSKHKTLSDIKSTIQRKVDKVVEKMAPPPPEDSIERDIEDVAEEAKSLIERTLGDISKTSATQQLLIGSASGWVTGVVATKFGKLLAVALGGGIIALQVANHQGYITVNWDQIMSRVDSVTDKVGQRVNKEGPQWMDKMERFVDRKLDKAEDLLKKNQRKAKHWYHSVTGTGPDFQLEKIHIFTIGFVAGVSIGLITG